jgi:DNA polymerase III delta subunit
VKLTDEAKKLLTNYSMGNLMQAENDIKKLKLIYDKQEVDESMLLSLSLMAQNMMDLILSNIVSMET